MDSMSIGHWRRRAPGPAAVCQWYVKSGLQGPKNGESPWKHSSPALSAQTVPAQTIHVIHISESVGAFLVQSPSTAVVILLTACCACRVICKHLQPPAIYTRRWLMKTTTERFQRKDPDGPGLSETVYQIHTHVTAAEKLARIMAVCCAPKTVLGARYR